MQGKYIGGLCSSLKGAIRKDKAFDKCLSSLLGQVVISFSIFILTQYMRDLCKQVAAISKKCSTNQCVGCSAFGRMTSIQGQPITKTMPAGITRGAAESRRAGRG